MGLLFMLDYRYFSSLSVKLLKHLLFVSLTPTICMCLPKVSMVLDPRISSLALCGLDLCGVGFFYPTSCRICKLASLSSVFFHSYALSDDGADTAVHKVPSC